MLNRNHLRRLAAAVCTASLAFGVASVGTAEASHSSTCTVPEATQAFSSFGDLGWYYLTPGGDFEATTPSWATRGVVLPSISHAFDLYPGSGGLSLRLLSGSRVTTPKLCVAREITHLRFLAKAAPGSGRLDVKMRVYGADEDEDKIIDRSIHTISPSDHASWGPSQNISTTTEDLEAGQRAYVEVRFHSHGDWTIDDVLIDPYRRG